MADRILISMELPTVEVSAEGLKFTSTSSTMPDRLKGGAYRKVVCHCGASSIEVPWNIDIPGGIYCHACPHRRRIDANLQLCNRCGMAISNDRTHICTRATKVIGR